MAFELHGLPPCGSLSDRAGHFPCGDPSRYVTSYPDTAQQVLSGYVLDRPLVPHAMPGTIVSEVAVASGIAGR